MNKIKKEGFFLDSFFPKNHKVKMNFSIPRILPNSRRGLSMVVTSLIIILLVLVAIGIIWVVVQNIISEGSEQVSLGQFTIDLEIKKVTITDDITLSQIDVVVKRNPGEGELMGVNFIVEGNDVAEVYPINLEDAGLTLGELGQNTFPLDLTGTSFGSASEIEKVSIAPILITSGGNEFVGSEIDAFESSSFVIVEATP